MKWQLSIAKYISVSACRVVCELLTTPISGPIYLWINFGALRIKTVWGVLVRWDLVENSIESYVSEHDSTIRPYDTLYRSCLDTEYALWDRMGNKQKHGRGGKYARALNQTSAYPRCFICDSTAFAARRSTSDSDLWRSPIGTAATGVAFVSRISPEAASRMTLTSKTPRPGTSTVPSTSFTSVPCSFLWSNTSTSAFASAHLPVPHSVPPQSPSHQR
jgi:hypothetical protein